MASGTAERQCRRAQRRADGGPEDGRWLGWLTGGSAAGERERAFLKGGGREVGPLPLVRSCQADGEALSEETRVGMGCRSGASRRCRGRKASGHHQAGDAEWKWRCECEGEDKEAGVRGAANGPGSVGTVPSLAVGQGRQWRVSGEEQWRSLRASPQLVGGKRPWLFRPAIGGWPGGRRL